MAVTIAPPLDPPADEPATPTVVVSVALPYATWRAAMGEASRLHRRLPEHVRDVLLEALESGVTPLPTPDHYTTVPVFVWLPKDRTPPEWPARALATTEDSPSRVAGLLVHALLVARGQVSPVIPPAFGYPPEAPELPETTEAPEPEPEPPLAEPEAAPAMAEAPPVRRFRPRRDLELPVIPPGAIVPSGAEIGAARETLGIRQGELAREAGISRGEVSAYETGKRTNAKKRYYLATALVRMGAPASLVESFGVHDGGTPPPE